MGVEVEKEEKINSPEKYLYGKSNELKSFNLFSSSKSIGGQRHPDLGLTPSRDVSSDTQQEAKAYSFINLHA